MSVSDDQNYLINGADQNEICALCGISSGSSLFAIFTCLGDSSPKRVDD